VCDSAATRPSSQITLDKLVTNDIIMIIAIVISEYSSDESFS